MTFPVVQTVGYSVEASAVTTHDVTVPSGITAGDELLLLIAFGGVVTADPTVSGWTKVAGVPATNMVYAYRKVASGGESNFTYTTTTSVTSANRCLRISDAATTAPEADINSGNASHPNSPNLDPAGWGAEDTLWLSWVNWADATDSLSAYPTSYSGNQFTSYPWVSGLGVALSTRNLNASAENPGAYTLTGAADSWESLTIAVRPAVSGATKDVATAASLSTPTVRDMPSAASLNVPGVRDVATVASLSIRLPKSVQYKVYTPPGVLLRTWTDPASVPSFSWPINGGPSSMTLQLPRQWSAAGEVGEAGSANDLALGNLVVVSVVDGETSETGLVIYRGSIEEYEIGEPPSDGVRVLLVPRSSRFADHFVYGPLVFAGADPAAMAEYLVDNNYLPGISWDASNPTFGVLFSETFSKEKAGQIMERIRRLAGSKAYWRLNADESLTFRSWDVKAAPTHTLRGPHISHLRYIRSRMGVKTRAFVFGAETEDENGAVIGRVEAIAVSTDFDPDDPRDIVHTDSRITDNSSAQRMATSLLEYHKVESIETEIDIPDNSVNAAYGYDIESLKPGDTLAAYNPAMVYAPTRWGAFDWSEEEWSNEYAGLVQGPLVIAHVDYQYTHARVKLTTRPAPVIEELVNLADRVLLMGST